MTFTLRPQRSEVASSGPAPGIVLTWGLPLSALLALFAGGCAASLESKDTMARAKLAEVHGRAIATSAPMCALVGPTGNHPGVYGTDLGFTVRAHNDKDRMWVLFGDTWGEAGNACRYAPEDDDDLFAWLPQQRPATLPNSPEKMRTCGVIDYELGTSEDVRSWSRCRVYGQPVGASNTPMPLSMGFLRTPISAFASSEHVYGIFHRSQPRPCDDQGRCPGDTQCSKDIAQVNVGVCKLPDAAPGGGAGNFCRSDDDCMLGSCEPAKQGLCLSSFPFKIDTAAGSFAPSWYRDNPLRGLLKVMQIGRLEGPRPGDFVVEEKFATNRFVNVSARTVAHFDPDSPARNDYRPGYHTLLLWGRPAFSGERGAQSLPFLLYQRLPEPGKPLVWNPRFFAGLDHHGRPIWATIEENAKPIYGGQPVITSADGKPKFEWLHPEFDHVNQMSVAWVPEAERWIMLYGGDMPDFMLYDENGDRMAPVHPQPAPGAVHMRTARHPWGGSTPAEGFTQPVPVFTRQDAAAYMACPDSGSEEMPGCLSKGDPHGPFALFGTLLDHATSLKPSAFLEVAGQCLVGDATMDVLQSMSGNQVGRLYGVNIIEPWMAHNPEAGGQPASVDLYWNVSTWNPYQVILVRTRLHLSQLK